MVFLLLVFGGVGVGFERENISLGFVGGRGWGLCFSVGDKISPTEF